MDIQQAAQIGVLSHGYEETLTLITYVPNGIYDHRIILTALPMEMVASQ